MNQSTIEQSKPSWYGWAILGGAGLTAVGIGMGIGFTVLADQESNNGIQQLALIKQKQEELYKDKKPGPTYLDNLCHEALVQAECEKQQQIRSRLERNHAIAFGSFLVGGLAAAGTIGLLVTPYIFPELWHGRKAGSINLVPALGKDCNGIQIYGAF